MTTAQIITIVAVVLILGIIIFPLVNRRQFRNLEPDQQIRLIMKEAKGLVYFKNVSNGSTGVLFYVKNKRKILALPWVLDGGNMLCTKENPFSNWDYQTPTHKHRPPSAARYCRTDRGWSVPE